jgi:hypothetical protein
MAPISLDPLDFEARRPKALGGRRNPDIEVSRSELDML